MAVGPSEPGRGGDWQLSPSSRARPPKAGVCPAEPFGMFLALLSPLFRENSTARPLQRVPIGTSFAPFSDTKSRIFAALVSFSGKTEGLVTGCAESSIYDLGFCRLKVPNPRILPEKTIPNPSFLTENLRNLAKTEGLVSRCVGSSVSELAFVGRERQIPAFGLKNDTKRLVSARKTAVPVGNGEFGYREGRWRLVESRAAVFAGVSTIVSLGVPPYRQLDAPSRH